MFTSKNFSVCKIHQINNSKSKISKFNQSIASRYWRWIHTSGVFPTNKSKLIGALSLVKSMVITCDLLVYFPAIIKHKYIKIHVNNELNKPKFIGSITNKIVNRIDRSIKSGSNNKRMMINQKGEDMQSTSKFLAYLRHSVLQRGDYIT